MGLFDRLRQRDEDSIKAERLELDDDVTSAEPDDDDELEVAKEAPADREIAGPFDEREAPERSYIDFGALRVPAVDGMGIRVEFHETTRAVVGVAIDVDGSSLQVQAFAAPRSTGLWRTVRHQLGASLEEQGASVDEIETEVGTGLVATVSAEGGTKQRTLKFLGVDGPRWFVRGVVSGPAARDDKFFTEILEVFRGLVIVRGEQAIPPRDLLVMTMPDALAEQMRARSATAATEA